MSRSLCRSVLSLLLVVACPAAAAQEAYCDPGLPTADENPLRYKPRGASPERPERCEGLYIQEVGSTTLLVTSLTASFEDYDLSRAQPLHIAWPALGDGAVRLRAQGLRHRLYYRMDTARPPGTTAYRWPTGILAALDVEREDLGVLGWTQHRVGGAERNVYLPLQIWQHSRSAEPAGYQLVLVPGRELAEVFVSLTTAGEDGSPATVIQSGTALGYGYYPAGRAVGIPLPALEGAGVYHLEVGATLRQGGATAVELWFYHPGP